MGFNRRAVLFGLWGAAMAASAKAQGKTPMFSIGAIADSQYADAPDAPPRFYRAALGKLERAVDDLNTRDLKFVAHLGDYIDRDWKSYETQRPVKAMLKHPWRFVLGNHDFNVENDKKMQVPGEQGLLSCFNMQDDPQPVCQQARFHAFEESGWRFIVLDGNDLSTYAWPAGSDKDKLSRKIHDEQYPDAKPWNGGIGAEQMAWLEGELCKADADGAPVMLLCHFPIWPEADPDIKLWNAAEVVALIEKHPSAKVWLNGHEHAGGYGVRAGLHYLNLKGMLDTEETSYAVIDFYADRLEVQGIGREPGRRLMLR